MKILLQKENRPIPRFHNQGSHTSLPRSRSHSGPTNPWNRPQTIPKRKHDSRSKGLSCPATTLADSPRPCGGRSVVTRRTVRYPWADGLLIATKRPDEHPTAQTVHTWSLDGPQATRAAQTVRDLWRTVRPSRRRSATPTRTVQQTPSGQN
jgi:hypothetical protein